MKFYKVLVIIILSVFLTSCGSNSKTANSDFSIASNASFDKKSKVHFLSKDKALELKISNPKNISIDSVTYNFQGQNVSAKIDLNDSKLGLHDITTTIHANGTSQNISYKILVLNDVAPKVYTYRIINEYPHDIKSYTQGLEFFNGNLYESTGQRGESKLRKSIHDTGEITKSIDLDSIYFGEGLTILNEKIFQLTWESKKGFIYDVDTFDKLQEFDYNKSKEGWGICNDGKKLYKSDGTDKIWLLNPDTLEEESYIQTYTNKGKIVGINEMEWIDGKIYANRYQLDGVAIINPINGAIEGVIDFRSLKKKVTQHKGLDVLNGLAWNSETNTLFVTGKRWDKLFEVEIIEK